MAKKYYAVKSGRQIGIFGSWDECKAQVHGFPAAIYKSFPNLEDAEKYLGGADAKSLRNDEGYNIYVDGSFSKKNHKYSWAFAVYNNNECVHTDCGVGENDEAVNMHNVAGELSAAMRAVKWAADNNAVPVIIHHDYTGIAAWANGEWKTNNKFTKAYAAYMSRVLSWVRFNKVKGHSGIEGNELADKLANEAMANAELPD